MNKQKITIIVLAIALFLLIQYLLFDQMLESRNHEITESFQEGYVEGAADAISEIFVQIEDCQISSLTIGNYTKSIIDYSCLGINIDK
jgi:hypothetical protein